VVVVGPASAPSRSREVPRIDALLARLSARHGVQYVRMSGETFPYLPDRLHLTPAGQRAFGDLVAARITG
jgi:acyl-CoA thioesterase-1